MVINIDTTEECVRGRYASPRFPGCVVNINDLLQWSSGYNRAVHVIDSHSPEDVEFKVWDNHAMKGSPAASLVPEIAVDYKRDEVLHKNSFSAFNNTGLDYILTEYAVDTLIFTGAFLDISIRHSVIDAFYRGYDTVVPFDAVMLHASDEEVDGSLDIVNEMRVMYGTLFAFTDEVLRMEVNK